MDYIVTGFSLFILVVFVYESVRQMVNKSKQIFIGKVTEIDYGNRNFNQYVNGK